MALVLLAPGMGDGVQAAKAGILEIGDIFVVNKSDRDGAQALIREIRGMIALGERPPGAWKPPIVSTVAHQQQGIAELWRAVETFRAAQRATGEAERRRADRARREVEQLALAQLRAEFRLDTGLDLDGLARAVSRGILDPYAAADQRGQSRPRRAAWLTAPAPARTVERATVGELRAESEGVRSQP